MVDFRIELIILPVTDVDRARAFYGDTLGWPVDHDQTVERGDPLRPGHAPGLGGLGGVRQGPQRDDARLAPGDPGGRRLGRRRARRPDGARGRRRGRRRPAVGPVRVTSPTPTATPGRSRSCPTGRPSGRAEPRVPGPRTLRFGIGPCYPWDRQKTWIPWEFRAGPREPQPTGRRCHRAATSIRPSSKRAASPCRSKQATHGGQQRVTGGGVGGAAVPEVDLEHPLVDGVPDVGGGEPGDPAGRAPLGGTTGPARPWRPSGPRRPGAPARRAPRTRRTRPAAGRSRSPPASAADSRRAAPAAPASQARASTAASSPGISASIAETTSARIRPSSRKPARTCSRA